MYQADDKRYCYPGTTVLKNKAGVRDQVDLDKFEAVQVSRRMGERIPPGRMDASHYRAIHRHLFRDVYSWSGRYRERGISKGDSEFCQPEYINREMERLFADLADGSFFRDLEPEVFAAKAAHFLADLNAIHPFREGNGRTQTIFLGLLADQADHPLDFDRVDPQELLHATIASFY